MILIVSAFHLNYTKNMSKYLVQTKKRQSSTFTSKDGFMMTTVASLQQYE